MTNIITLNLSSPQGKFSCIIENMDDLIDKLSIIQNNAPQDWSHFAFKIHLKPFLKQITYSNFDQLKEKLASLPISALHKLDFVFIKKGVSLKSTQRNQIIQDIKAEMTIAFQWPEGSYRCDINIERCQYQHAQPINSEEFPDLEKRKIFEDEGTAIFCNLQKHLNAIQPIDGQGLFNENQGKVIQLHHEALQKLTETAKGLSAGVINWQQHWEDRRRTEADAYKKEREDRLQALDLDYNQKKLQLETQYKQKNLESEELFTKKQQDLLSEHNEKLKLIDEKINQREAELNKKEEELNARAQTMNLASSRDERRKIRENLKQQLQDRSVRFAVTNQTSVIYWIINGFAAILLCGLIYLGYNLLQVGIDDGSNVHWSIFVRQILISVALGTIVFVLIRWNQSWFHQRVFEEFRLKRLDLDIDRASWVVEMAMEWSRERNTDIPPSLLETLSRGMFEPLAGQLPISPADAVTALLLNSQGKVSVNAGGIKADIESKALQSTPGGTTTPATSTSPSNASS